MSRPLGSPGPAVGVSYERGTPALHEKSCAPTQVLHQRPTRRAKSTSLSLSLEGLVTCCLSGEVRVLRVEASAVEYERERFFVELMTSDRKLKASREGSE